MSEYICESGMKPRHKPYKRVAGVVGASFSGVSIMVANILRLFKVSELASLTRTQIDALVCGLGRTDINKDAGVVCTRAVLHLAPASSLIYLKLYTL